MRLVAHTPARGPRSRVIGPVGVALFAVLASSACQAGPPALEAGAHRTSPPAVAPLPIPSAAAGQAAGASAAAAVYGGAKDALLPDPKVTPGAAFTDVDTAVLCDLHYTLGVRQPHFNDKVTAFASYGVSIHERDSYQVDHLIPVGLGGSNALGNLWPQPYGARGAAQKDELENKMRALVCAGQLDLATAQKAIAQDWLAASDAYLNLPVPAGPLSTPSASASPDPFEVKNGGSCPAPGTVGLTIGKGIRFTCQPGDDGALRWAKRY